MPKERPATQARTAAQAALRFRHRPGSVIDEVAEEEIGPDREGLGRRLACRFVGEGCQVTVTLQPVATGWTGTVTVEGEPRLQVTVFRGDGFRGSFAGLGEADLGFLAPGPVSLTCELPDGRAVQTAWITLSGAHIQAR